MVENRNTEDLRSQLDRAQLKVRQLEQELGFSYNPKDFEDLIKVTVEQMHEGIQIINFDWCYVYLNDACVRHGHRPKSELLGRTMQECYPGIENTEVFQVLAAVMLDRKPRSTENLFEYPDNTKCWFDLYVEPHALGILIRSVDITSKKNLEAQYLHAQKMESIGLLAAGVAHDFNNKLGIMMLYCEMMKKKIGNDNDVYKDYLENILIAVEDAASMTKQLLAFGRKQVLDPRVTNLNDVIQLASKSVGKLIGSHIELKTSLDKDLHNVRVDPSQIDQVILNLCLNSRDAMPEGGVLTLETANVEFDEDYCSKHMDVIPGEYVMLAVCDTGNGIHKENIDHIFDPFFTTKDVGKGTGLGLSSVHGIVKQSRGHIWVYSEIGLGTTIKLYFPRVKDLKESVGKHSHSEDDSKGSETILLVEDEELLREVFAEVLLDSGYHVLVAANSEDAKTQFLKAKGEIDLLLTDIVFPKSNGLKLSKELSAINPDLKTIFVSGYTKNTIVHHGNLDTEAVLVQKPVSVKILLSTVRKVLGGQLTKGVV